MKTRLALLTFFLLATAIFAAKNGEPAPGFTLPDTHGKTHALADYKGKFVVLEWVNFGCPFVRKHYDANNMQSLQKEYTGKGVIWLSICSSAPGKQGNMSPEEWNKNEMEKGAAPTAVLIDADGKVGRSYEAKTTPHMFIINPEGKLIYQGGIDSIASTDKADIEKASNYIKVSLEEALAGKPISNPQTKPYGCSVKY
jgi:hypothetical protein